MQQAEGRFGNGNGLYDIEEQRTAVNAWYNVNNGAHVFTDQPLHIRLGIELSF